MEEKKLPPEEIEVLKAAKVIKAYSDNVDCSFCVFCFNGFCYLGDECPHFWPLDDMPEVLGQ